MLGKRIINTGGVSCTTDTTQILDAGTTQSIALYRFEDNADDTSNSTGKFGKGASFNGTNSYINTNATLIPTSATDDFSISFWINPNNQFGTILARGLVSTGGVCYGFRIAFDSTNNRIRFNRDTGVSCGSTPNANTGNGTITQGVWNHVVIIYDASANTVTFYINGSLSSTVYQNSSTGAVVSGPMASGAISFNSSYDGGVFKFGNRNNALSNSPFSGKLDQIRIFNKTVSSSEVTTLYTESTSTVNTLQVLGDTSCTATYTFEGNANDLSTNYNGTSSNVIYDYNGTESNITYATGKFGKAAVFNGSSSEVTINNFATLSQVGISMWVNIADVTSSYGLITKYASNDREFSIYNYQASNGFIAALYYNGNNSNSITLTASDYLTNNTWHHIAYTADGVNKPRLYIDGVQTLETAQSNNNTYYSTSQPISLGSFAGSASYFFDGKIDQVRVFKESLSPGEISSLYNETATSAASGTINNPSTVAYYKMAGGSDETGSYDATTINNVNFNVEGKYGFAGKFNGSSSQIVLPNSLDSALGNNNFSYSFWIKGPMTSTNQIWFSLAQNYFIYIGYFSGAIYISLYNNTFSTGVSISVGTWTHIVFVKSSSSGITIYKNGTSAYTSTTAAAKANLGTSGNGQINVIGKYSGGGYQFDGNLDQIRLFNKAISAAEATTLYNEIQCANTITTPESYFNTKLYTGNGGTQSITGVGFKPDLTWVKNRDVTGNHSLIDSVRGVSKPINSNTNGGEQNYPGYALTSFLNDGFSVTDTSTGIYGWNGPAGSTYGGSTGAYVSWNWKGASSSVTNNVGTITSTVSASPESGFSIVKYTATGTIITNTVGHGLTTKPSLIIQKAVASGANWFPITDVIDGSVDYFYLNSDAAKGDMTGIYADFSINDTTFTNWYSPTSGDVITYCFANVDGYQRIGSYVGTGSAGPFVYTGFEPAWLMIKEASNTGNWCIYDNKRDTVNPNNNVIAANSNNTESSYSSGYNVNFYTNGFEIAENTSNDLNTSGSTYMFMAIAANPDTTAPTKANSFKTVLYTGNNSTQSITGVGWKPDLVWVKSRASSGYDHNLYDSIRGVLKRIKSNTNSAEDSNGKLSSFDANGFSLIAGGDANANGQTMVAWNWKALDHDRNLASINNDGSIPSIVSANPAAGFSVVKWTGTGVDGTKIGHGLQGSPEMIITKGLSNATSWVIGVGNISGLSINDYFTFTSYAKANSSTFYQAYSTNTFQVGVSAANEMNKSSSNQYISYCFRTIAGHSKIGTYEGTNSTVTVSNVGFKPSFVMIKNVDDTSNWVILDNSRNTITDRLNNWLRADTSDAETGAVSTAYITVNDNGFIVANSTSSGTNANGDTYLYMAFK